MKVIIDSDALFALYVASDSHHSEAEGVFRKLYKAENEIVASNLVLQETATIISYRLGQETAISFLSNFERSGIKQLFVGEKLTIKSWNLFRRQTKKGTSFIDCTNIVVYSETKAELIMSFDKFYKREGLTLANNEL